MVRMDKISSSVCVVASCFGDSCDGLFIGKVVEIFMNFLSLHNHCDGSKGRGLVVGTQNLR